MSDVIERLRAANPVLDCAPPPIDGVWRRVEDADVDDRASASASATDHQSRPGGRPARGTRRPRRWPSVGNAVATLAALAGVGVAVGIIALLGHTRGSRPPARSALSPSAVVAHARPGELAGGPADLAARLRSLRGVPVLVTIWASWCPPCREDLRALDATAGRDATRVAVLGVDADEPMKRARAFLARHPTSFPSYHAAVRQVSSALPGLGTIAGVPGLGTITGLPTTVYIDRAGRVVNVHAGAYTTPAALQRDITTYLKP